MVSPRPSGTSHKTTVMMVRRWRSMKTKRRNNIGDQVCQHHPSISGRTLLRLVHEVVTPTAIQHPAASLLCTNLPQEVTDDVLSVLFQQYVMYSVHDRSITTLRIGIAGSNRRMSRKHQPQMRQVQRSKWHKYSSNLRNWHLLRRKL